MPLQLDFLMYEVLKMGKMEMIRDELRWELDGE
jgi:hypothetical protein